MLCAALLKDTAPALPAETPLAEAARALAAADGNGLAVCSADGRYIGLFTLDVLLARALPRMALAGGMEANLRFIGDTPSDLTANFTAVATEPVSKWCDPDAPVLWDDTPAIAALRLFCGGARAIALLDHHHKWLGTLTARDAIRVIAGEAG